MIYAPTGEESVMTMTLDCQSASFGTTRQYDQPWKPANERPVSGEHGPDGLLWADRHGFTQTLTITLQQVRVD